LPESLSARNEFASIALVIILSVIWGLAFVAIRSAVQELTPVNLTLLRWLIVSGAFLALAPFIGKPKTPLVRGDIPRFVLVSFASVVGYHLSLNYAETIVSAGLAGLLISFGPIFVVLLSAVFLKEKIATKLIIALALAVAGAFMLSINADLSFQQMSGPIGVVLSAFLYGSYTVASKPLVKKYGAMPVAVWVGVLGTVFLLPLLSWGFVVNVSSLSASGWISVLYLAILSTVLANIILYTLIGGRAVSSLSVQLYLIPIVSLVGGILLLGESHTAFTVLGAGLMLTATALATRRK
jgi:drug/metabolite transporter (DMT)-like permease